MGYKWTKEEISELVIFVDNFEGSVDDALDEYSIDMKIRTGRNLRTFEACKRQYYLHRTKKGAPKKDLRIFADSSIIVNSMQIILNDDSKGYKAKLSALSNLAEKIKSEKIEERAIRDAIEFGAECVRNDRNYMKRIPKHVIDQYIARDVGRTII
ncbi:hypothetical protein [Elizabethkingia phage TCUEAP1]|nr:hypothetical protein [Elizabethkingia phage TCUEAP1]